jgi:hypothetical protein
MSTSILRWETGSPVSTPAPWASETHTYVPPLPILVCGKAYGQTSGVAPPKGWCHETINGDHPRRVCALTLTEACQNHHQPTPNSDYEIPFRYLSYAELEHLSPDTPRSKDAEIASQIKVFKTYRKSYVKAI